MQVDMDTNVYMRIDGTMAELILETDDELYRPYMIMEKGKPVIYMELHIALYGMM